MLTTSSGTAVKSANVTLSAAQGLARQQPWQDVTDPSVSLSTVTLSEAKGLARRTERCFAEFTLSEANGLSRTARIPLKSAHGASLISKCLPSPVLALDKSLSLEYTHNRQESVI